jgi:regulatory protein
MPVITSITEQKKRSERVSVFVDGDFFAGTHQSVIVKLGLKTGDVVDMARLQELLDSEITNKAFTSALRLLSYRARTESELILRLKQKTFPEAAILEAINKLKELGYLNDQKFTKEYVVARTLVKPMGKIRLKNELVLKGVKKELVEDALEKISEEDEVESARALTQRRIAKADKADVKLKDRLAAFLNRRGFDWETINKVLEQELGEL